MYVLRRFLLGFLAGLVAGFLSALGIPVSLVLASRGMHMLSSSAVVNYFMHVALNTTFWTVLGVSYAWRRKMWIVLAGFLTGTTIVVVLAVFLVLLLVIIGEILGDLTAGL